MIRRVYSYLNSAKKILDQYSGEQPFSLFIKDYFRQYKKYGSTDRKQITHLCYFFFRLGKAALELPFEERILLALFLCSQEPNEILKELKPEFNEKINLSPDEKLVHWVLWTIGNKSRQSAGAIGPLTEPSGQGPGGNRPTGSCGQLTTGDIFPWKEVLSKEIDRTAFIHSLLDQPNLFLRLRPGYEESIKTKLSDAEIPFTVINNSCLELPNSSKLDKIIELDKEAIIQDYNSQQTGEFIKSAIFNRPVNDTTSQISVWDCCAGSGGKSILAYDLIPNINLTVSDIRESILVNLKKRFEKAGIKKYKRLVVDHLIINQPPVPSPQYPAPSTQPSTPYDMIIFDAPCTGSGTWSRTPEQLYYFKEEKISYYSALQKNIATNVIPHLKEGGSFVYITCSVFKEENEDIVEYIQKEFQLKLEKTQLLKGYDKNADSMFVAVFRR